MVNYPAEFKAALAEQIRPRGHCEVSFKVGNQLTTINELYVQSVYFHLTGDPISRRLPTEEAKIELLDYEKYFHPDKPDGVANAKSANYWWTGSVDVKIRFGMEINGTVYYGDPIWFISETPPDWRGSMATFNCVRKLETLNGVFRRFQGSISNMYALAQQIIQDADATASYSFDSNELPYYPVEPQCLLQDYTHNDALLALAAAHGMAIRTTKDGVVEIKDFYTVRYGSGTDIHLTNVVVSADDMLEEPTASKLPTIRNELLTYPLSANTNAEETTLLEYENTFTSTDQVTLWMDLEKPGIPTTYHVTVDGVDSVGIFTGYRDVLYAQFTPSSTTLPVTIFVTGVPAKTDDVTLTMAHYEDGVLVDGTDDDEFKNPLMTDRSVRVTGSKRIKYLYETRDAYSIKYRGDPRIEPYDIIQVEIPFVGIVPCIVLDVQFTYNGAFSGNLVVRKVDGEEWAYTSTNAVVGTAIAGRAICGWTDE